MSKVDSIISIVIFYFCKSFIIIFITLLNVANPCHNWTFLRFARVAEKERTQRNKIKKSLGFEPRPSVYRADALPTELRYQLADPEF